MKTPMVIIKLNEVLQEKGRTLYWLAQNSSIPHVTLWNLSKVKTQRSINLSVLSRICAALECLPGDLLVYVPDPEDEAVSAMVKSRAAKEVSKKAKSESGKT